MIHDVAEMQDYLQLWGTGGSVNPIKATITTSVWPSQTTTVPPPSSCWRTTQTAEFSSHHLLTRSHLPQTGGAKLLAVRGRPDTTGFPNVWAETSKSDILEEDVNERAVLLHQDRETAP